MPAFQRTESHGDKLNPNGAFIRVRLNLMVLNPLKSGQAVRDSLTIQRVKAVGSNMDQSILE